MTHATPEQLAAFVARGDRGAYIRAWYRDLRNIGIAAHRALHLARVFWRSYRGNR